MRYVGNIIPGVVADVEVDQSMEEGFEEGVCNIGGVVGWWDGGCMMDDSLLELVGERFSNAR